MPLAMSVLGYAQIAASRSPMECLMLANMVSRDVLTSSNATRLRRMKHKFKCTDCGHEQLVSAIVNGTSVYYGSGANWCDECEGLPKRVYEHGEEPVQPVQETFTREETLALIASAVLVEREACAVTAWSTGMDLHMKSFDAREIGSKCSQAIRNRPPLT